MSARRTLLGIAFSLIPLFLAGEVAAGQYSLQGSLPVSSDPQATYSYTFTLNAPAAVVAQSFGYGGTANAPGGRNLAGVVVPAGGFDPYLSLFAGTGPAATFVASNDDSACPPGTADAGLCLDSRLSIALPAGAYTLVLSNFSNMSFAENLGSGTLGDGFIGLGAEDPSRTDGFAIDLFSSALTVAGDLNADGRADILWRNYGSGQIYRMLMNGLAVGPSAEVYAEPNTLWTVVGHADFNGDGVTDLLWRNASDGSVYVMPFNSSGQPTAGAVVYNEPNAAWKIIHTPDLDGDGKADLLWWNSVTGQVYATLLNGTSVVAAGMVHVEPNTAWKIVAAGDFQGSGKNNQLLWRNSSTGQVYLMSVAVAGGVFSASGQVIYQEPNTAWKIISAADFNADGRSDILWRNSSTGQVFLMLMNGPVIAAQGVVYQEPNTAWKIVAQGDYNGDGRADLLWRNDTTGQVYMMLMQGFGIIGQGIVHNEPNTQWKILGTWEYGQATGIFQ